MTSTPGLSYHISAAFSTLSVPNWYSVDEALCSALSAEIMIVLTSASVANKVGIIKTCESHYSIADSASSPCLYTNSDSSMQTNFSWVSTDVQFIFLASVEIAIRSRKAWFQLRSISSRQSVCKVLLPISLALLRLSWPCCDAWLSGHARLCRTWKLVQPRR